MLVLGFLLAGCGSNKGPRLFAGEALRQTQETVGVVAAVKEGSLAVRSGEVAGAPVRSFPRAEETVLVSQSSALAWEALPEGAAVRLVFDPKLGNQLIRVDVLEGPEEVQAQAAVEEKERSHTAIQELLR